MPRCENNAESENSSVPGDRVGYPFRNRRRGPVAAYPPALRTGTGAPPRRGASHHSPRPCQVAGRGTGLLAPGGGDVRRRAARGAGPRPVVQLQRVHGLPWAEARHPHSRPRKSAASPHTTPRSCTTFASSPGRASSSCAGCGWEAESRWSSPIPGCRTRAFPSSCSTTSSGIRCTRSWIAWG